MPEMLDIVDENGVPTGQSVPRTPAHAEGLRHRTSHVWIVRRKNGRVQVLLQMRCAPRIPTPAATIFPLPGTSRRARSSSARPCGSCARSWA